MNNVFVVAVVAALAGFGGAWAFGQMGDSAGSDGDVAGAGDADLLREQVADLKREIELLKNPPATLGADAPVGVRTASGDQAAVVEAVLEKLDERVDARVATKMQELAASDDAQPARRGPWGRGSSRKRVSLEDAARELELSAAEEDELRRIYDESMNRFMKLAAGPDGDVEDVKRDLEEMKKNPAGARGMMMKYVPNMMKNIGEVMTISTERQAAVEKAIGKDKARRLNSEFDVIEANPMGQTFRVGASMGSEMPSGR